MSEVKQVIVMRADLKSADGKKVRTGKLIAQGAHASVSFLTRKIQSGKKLSEVENEWCNGRFAKICLKVESEQELNEIHQKALCAGLESHLIIDSGLTEFNGVPTKTCLAIGPDYSSKIDKITGNLSLF